MARGRKGVPVRGNVKMLVVDLDDTLLDSNLTISDETKSAVAAVLDRGIHVVIASGRPTESIYPHAFELGLPEGVFLISYNGACLSEFRTNKVRYQNNLQHETFIRLCDVADHFNLYIHTYLNGVIVTDKPNKFTDFESELTGLKVNVVQNLRQYVGTDVVKVLLLQEPDIIKAAESRIRSLKLPGLTTTISKPFFLECTNRGVDKNKTVSIALSKYGIDKRHVMAIGDGFNDLSMIQGCGIGVAMGNACSEIKDSANFITRSNNDHGVAHAIKKLIIGE